MRPHNPLSRGLLSESAIPSTQGKSGAMLQIPRGRIALAALMLAVTAAHAQDFGLRQTIGDSETCAWSGVGGFYGTTASSSGVYDGSGGGLGASGKANLCGPGIGIQVDTVGEVVNGGDEFGFYSDAQLGGIAHLYRRTARHAFGVLAGVNTQFNGYQDFNPGIVGVFGLDAHLYLNRVTLAFQATYFKSFGQDPASYDVEHGWTVSGEVRGFSSPDTKWTIGLGWHSDVDIAILEQANDFFLAAGVEHRLRNLPVSLFADVTRHWNVIAGSNLPTTVVRFGGAFHFNQESLFTEDRSGASFTTPQIDTFTNLANTYYR
jgi:hypothetical protein